MRKLSYEEMTSELMYHEFAKGVLKGQKDIEEILEHGSAEDFLVACNYINYAKPGIYAPEELEAFKKLANKAFSERSSKAYPFINVFTSIISSYDYNHRCEDRFYELCSFDLPSSHMAYAMKATLSMCALLNNGIHSLKQFDMALHTLHGNMSQFLYDNEGLETEEDKEAWIAREINAWRKIYKHLLNGNVPEAFNAMQSIAKETGMLKSEYSFIQLEKWEQTGDIPKEAEKKGHEGKDMDNGRTMVDARELLDMLYERKKVLAKWDGETDENPFITNMDKVRDGGRMAETEHMIHYLEKKVGMDS